MVVPVLVGVPAVSTVVISLALGGISVVVVVVGAGVGAVVALVRVVDTFVVVEVVDTVFPAGSFA